MIKIEKLDNATDVAALLKLDHSGIKEVFTCEKTEWIQWLNTTLDSRTLDIFSITVDEELYAYYVLLNNVRPPISDGVTIFYFSTLIDVKDCDGNSAGEKAMLEIKKYAVERKATKIIIFTRFPKVCEKYGFKEDQRVKRLSMGVN